MAMSFPTPMGRFFSQNATSCKPISEGNVPAVAVASYRRARACSGSCPAIAFSSIIGLHPVVFQEKIDPQVGVGKMHVIIILLFMLSWLCKGVYSRAFLRLHKISINVFNLSRSFVGSPFMQVCT